MKSVSSAGTESGENSSEFIWCSVKEHKANLRYFGPLCAGAATDSDISVTLKVICFYVFVRLFTSAAYLRNYGSFGGSILIFSTTDLSDIYFVC